MPCRAHFDLAVMCDIRVAADTARFAHPEIAFGDVVYGPFTDWIARPPRDVLKRTKAKAVRRAAVAGATLDL